MTKEAGHIHLIKGAVDLELTSKGITVDRSLTKKLIVRNRGNQPDPRARDRLMAEDVFTIIGTITTLADYQKLYTLCKDSAGILTFYYNTEEFNTMPRLVKSKQVAGGKSLYDINVQLIVVDSSSS